jgi:tRNA(Ile)-lysidine synthase
MMLKARTKVKQTIFNYEMIRPGDRVVVAVSGGPDSVCLLHLLYDLRDELGIDIVVAHFNHGLRPAEDEDETAFVRGLAESLVLPFETEKAAPALVADASIEEKARKARYRFLEKVRTTRQAQKIALGHSLDDQAETVLMRLLRGSGPSGLAGIPPVRDRIIIRPLIDVPRRDIEDYLKAHHCKYVTDSSNLQTEYLRNKIRLQLMPLLREYQPRLLERLGRTAELLRDENEYMDLLADHWLDEMRSSPGEGHISFLIDDFLQLPLPLRRRVARQAIKRIRKTTRRIHRRHIHAIHNLAQAEKPQGVLHLPKGLVIQKSYDRLIFSMGAGIEPRSFYYILEGPGTYPMEEIGKTLTLVEIRKEDLFEPGPSPWTVHLDAGKICYPLVARSPRPGDRFIPLGMKGHKKVKDFFVDLKVPSQVRQATLILFSGDTPIWIAGFRIDDRFKVQPHTKKILQATLGTLQNPPQPPFAKRGAQGRSLF